jgi:hypothetical protein
MMIPSGWNWLMSGVELAQEGFERAVIPLTQHLEPVSNEESGADALSGLVNAV